MKMVKNNISSVENTVNTLLDEGCFISCDETAINSKDLNDLPDWYDEKKYKRGQKFFHNYMFAMFNAKLCGLLSILLIPSIVKILKFTNKSSTPLTAYKRYMSTIFHMTLWYDEDFRPGSKLWQSIKTVRNLHSNASKRAYNNQLNRISQTDMVLTQFAFFGYIITNPKMFGICNATKEEYEGLIHLWRVIGHLLGIEDRFNLCRGSITETKEYCNLLIEKVFAKKLKEIDSESIEMSSALLEGLWVFQPFLNYVVSLTYIHRLCNVSIAENNNMKPFKTNISTKIHLYFVDFVMYMYQFYIFRLYHNIVQYISLYYIIKYFPFLAYYKFGYNHSHIQQS